MNHVESVRNVKNGRSSLINRDIINEFIDYDGHDRVKIDSLINRWKQLLHKRGAKQGDLVAIAILNVNVWHVSALFACAEMGLRVLLLDAPAHKNSLPYTKIARFGPARFCIDDGSGKTLYDGLHQKMITEYSEEILTPSQVSDMPNQNIDTHISPDTPFLVSSTSGTTKFSRKIEFTQQEVYEMSLRNIKIFRFSKASTVLHTKNMHHASAMITDLIPSLMCADRHFSMTLADRNDWHPTNVMDINRFIVKNRVTHMIVPNRDVLEWLLSTNVRYLYTVNMNMSGFTMGPEFIEMAEKHNIRFIQHYGSIDTAIPLMVRYVTSETKEQRGNCLGVLPDFEYVVTCDPVTGRITVTHHGWDEPRTMDDCVEYNDKTCKYYHNGRIDYVVDPDMVPPPDLDLTPFYQDTKINMDQLRGFLITKKSKENA